LKQKGRASSEIDDQAELRANHGEGSMHIGDKDHAIIKMEVYENNSQVRKFKLQRNNPPRYMQGFTRVKLDIDPNLDKKMIQADCLGRFELSTAGIES